jgi:hypothetical protein
MACAGVDWCGVAPVTIDMLPDIALLRIFDFYVYDKPGKWHTLVHVCRSWRNIAFGSPRRLDLRLFLSCTFGTPTKDILDLWPPFPIVIGLDYGMRDVDVDNIIAALENNDRIRELHLMNFPILELNHIFEEMQQPFPALTNLELLPPAGNSPVIPNSFLGGSAPRLQSLILYHITFPGLPNLPLSATHLVELDLWEIPDSGYISPEAMASCLSASTRLERIFLEFKSSQWRPDKKERRPPPQTRALLPVLTKWEFKGVCEYFQDLVARIDTPLLDDLTIIFFDQPTFDFSQLTQFITRAPKIKVGDEAGVVFPYLDLPVTQPKTLAGRLCLEILTD